MDHVEERSNSESKMRSVIQESDHATVFGMVVPCMADKHVVGL